MHQRINATANSHLVRRHNNGTILTLLNCADLAHCCYEYSTVNTRLDQCILDCRINVNITFLTTYDAEAALIKVVWVQILIILDVDALVQTV